MDGCCDICGSVGFVEALATCSKCLTSREHLYCMCVFQFELPTQWYCQDCEPEREATPPTCGTREDLATTSAFRKSSKVNNDTRQFAGSGSSNKGLKMGRFNSFKWERRVQTGRTQYIPVAEALKLPSGSKKSEQAFTNTTRSIPVLPQTTGQNVSPVKTISSKQLVNEHKHTADIMAQTRVEMAQKKAFVTPPPSIGCGTKVRPGNHASQSPKGKQPIGYLVDVGYPKSAKAKVEQVMRKTSRISNRFPNSSPRVKVAQEKALSPTSLSAICPPKIISAVMVYLTGELVGGDVHANVHLKSSEAEKDELKNLQPNVDLQSSEAEKDKLKNVQPAVKQYRGPAQDASWKGSFKMISDECNGELCCGIQGCPPSIVVKQVYEMSKKMPETLQFELLPRADLWKSIFQDRCPNFDDIGLFFFPSENKRCDNYFTWLEFIGKKDRVMRMCMWGVELLVFTSAHLHQNCQTWDGAHFFWGLFSVEKVRKSMMSDNRDVLRLCPPNEIWNCCSKGDESLAVDMVIDMEAGLDVGMVDVVKKRKSREDCCEAVGEPFITTTTSVASARLALSVVKEEPCNDSLVMERMCKQIATTTNVDMEAGMDVGTMEIVEKRISREDCCGAEGEPFIATTSNVASARLALSVVKEEPCDSPLVMDKMCKQIFSSQKNVSLQIDARAGALSSKEVHSDIPPGFKELKTLKATGTGALSSKEVHSVIPPGFKELQTLKTTGAGALSSKEVHSDIPPGFELKTLKTTVAIASNVPPGFGLCIPEN